MGQRDPHLGGQALVDDVGPGRLSGWRARGVWLVVAADLVWIAASVAIMPERPDLPLWGMAIFILMVASFGLVGALVATRQPRNPIGWILWSTSIIVTFAIAGDSYASYSLASFDGNLPGTVAIAWLSGIGLIPAFVTVVVFVPLLFPDGRLLSPRWRWVAWFAVAAIALGPIPPRSNLVLSPTSRRSRTHSGSPHSRP